jgi:hypothetical protein
MSLDLSYRIPNELRKEKVFSSPKISKTKKQSIPKRKELIKKYRKGLIWKDL